jgi:hypothetical protein
VGTFWIYSSLRGLSGFALSVTLANQPRFTKKRIATTTTASITKASTIFANVKFSTSLVYSGSSIGSGCFLSRSCSSAKLSKT